MFEYPNIKSNPDTYGKVLGTVFFKKLNKNNTKNHLMLKERKTGVQIPSCPLIFCFVLISLGLVKSYAQCEESSNHLNKSSKLMFHPDYLVVSEFCYSDVKTEVSKGKDTLFLPSSVFGFMIKEIWDSDTVIKKKPVIVFRKPLY